MFPSYNLRDLVGMSLTDRLGGEEEGVGLLGDTVCDGGSSHYEDMERARRVVKRGGRWEVRRTRRIACVEGEESWRAGVFRDLLLAKIGESVRVDQKAPR